MIIDLDSLRRARWRDARAIFALMLHADSPEAVTPDGDPPAPSRS